VVPQRKALLRALGSARVGAAGGGASGEPLPRPRRPERRRVLWIIPIGRRSSAYGYGQVKEETWADYVRATGRRGADRDDFADVADFIGWYGDLIHRRTAVAKHERYHLYLAYHEGPGGFAQGTHQEKDWLLEVARKVEARARLYQAQYLGCRDLLAASSSRRF